MFKSKTLKGILEVRSLLRNPEDTKQVFRVFSALRGKAYLKAIARLKKHEFGRRVLDGQLDLAEKLTDRTSLEELPPDSVGGTYLEFTSREQITAYGLQEASYETLSQLEDRNLMNFFSRMRDSHDLWHITTQYGRDPLGEACLLAFTYAQSRNRAILFILVFGYFKLAKSYGYGVIKALLEGFRTGRAAEWLPLAEWESILHEPIKDFRRRVHVEPPKHYQSFAKKYNLILASTN